MTPLECAQGITAFMKHQIEEYDENLWTIMQDGKSIREEIKVYTGFLPKAATKAELLKLCPGIVVRPESVSDEEERSVVHILLYVTTYDADMEKGYENLYHLLEWMRFQLLTNNPLPDDRGNEKWLIVNGSIKTTVPDEQPFPQWWGYMECDIYLPQPKNNKNAKLIGGY